METRVSSNMIWSRINSFISSGSLVVGAVCVCVCACCLWMYAYTSTPTQLRRKDWWTNKAGCWTLNTQRHSRTHTTAPHSVFSLYVYDIYKRKATWHLPYTRSVLSRSVHCVVAETTKKVQAIFSFQPAKEFRFTRAERIYGAIQKNTVA